MAIEKLYEQIRKDTEIWLSEIHGINHWLWVEANGHLIAEATQADLNVVSYFVYLHDCRRCNEYNDPQHGPRAASYARLHRELINLDNDQFDLLTRACSGHTYAMPNGKQALIKHWQLVGMATD